MSVDHDRMHPVFRELLAAPADPDIPPIEERSIGELRQEFENDMQAVDKAAPELASVADGSYPGAESSLPLRVYRADAAADGVPTILFFHGGGLFRGSIDSHDSICRVLAEQTGGVVVSAEYRKPPEDIYPAAVDDCFAALEWVAANIGVLGGDASQLWIAGDSAGACHAAAVTLRARDEGGPSIARQILYYPSVDHATPDEWESQELFGKGYWLDSAPFCIKLYLPDESVRAEAWASPLHAESHTGLPPAYICTAGFDPLRDQGKAYADKLAAAGVDVVYENYDNMLHGFVSCRGLVDEADACIKHSVRGR